MTRLGLAQLQVFALHRLLRVDQLLLQSGHGLHAAAERDHLALVITSTAAYSTGRSGPLLERWLTMRQRGAPFGARIAQQRLNFWPAVRSDGVGPRLADPLVGQLRRQFIAAKRHIADHAVPGVETTSATSDATVISFAAASLSISFNHFFAPLNCFTLPPCLIG